MIAALLMTAAVTACPAEQAVYALRTEPGVTARFAPVEKTRDWPAGLALRIDAHGGRDWFLPWAGGTNGEQNLASTLDPTQPGWRPPNPDGGPRPLGNLQYLGFDETYRLFETIPARGGPAPVHFLLPTLDDALRHPPADRPRQSIPRQFFDLVACEAP
ncbi:hypothetical protein [Caulobacter segnis]|uniref:hypothetical protein n=1 Tax=Caulobacter segnis TaxID=88688 RepID=UPI0028590B99|nr:hypothetical protein [Caulobacter segnis]MDR6623936.1 hypothetical protein [Caulobacter segnis]